MDTLYQNSLIDLAGLRLDARLGEITPFQGLPALRLDGLALLPFEGIDLSIEVSIATEGACYPGLAFRAADTVNYELAYAQPHTSGLWDALQYDPVFNHSNTWQNFYGPPYQKSTRVPTCQWFRLRLDVLGARLALSVDGQEPLMVQQLAHPVREGAIGIWTYLPAWFRDLRMTACHSLPEGGEPPAAPQGALDYWILEGSQKIACDPDGCLVLNRWLSPTSDPAHLSRKFVLPLPQSITFEFGFSDDLKLSVDGQEVFSGTNTFSPQTDFTGRGYVLPGSNLVSLDLPPGEHELSAILANSEYFGWGLLVTSDIPGAFI